MTHMDDALRHLQAAFDLGEIPPTDSLDIALTRVSFCLAALYDPADDEEDPGQPLRDFLTDATHYAHAHGLDIEAELESAVNMARQERMEWANR